MVRFLRSDNLFKFPDFLFSFKIPDFSALFHFPWLFPDFQDSGRPDKPVSKSCLCWKTLQSSLINSFILSSRIFQKTTAVAVKLIFSVLYDISTQDDLTDFNKVNIIQHTITYRKYASENNNRSSKHLPYRRIDIQQPNTWTKNKQ